MLYTCLWTHTTKRVSLVFHVDDLLAGTHQIIKEILTELSRDLELKSSEGDYKTNALPGTNPGKNDGRYNFGVDGLVSGKHAGRVQHVRAQELTNTALGTP